MTEQQDIETFWTLPLNTVMGRLNTSLSGLGSAEALERFERYGRTALNRKEKGSDLRLFISEFKSPIVIILLLATALSFVLHDLTDASIIFAIILISGLLGFWQERGAVHAVEKLLSVVRARITTLRNGDAGEVPLDKIVPGDIVFLNAGDVIPGDCLIFESDNLFADEAALTGETFPVEKVPGIVEKATPLSGRTNVLFMGTHVVSGTGKAVVVRTGPETEFGKISQSLRYRPPETEFEAGIRRFGYLLAEVTLILVISIFAINVYFQRPVLDSLLFSVALAVGLTPQLLPAIISVNLSHGAKKMADKKVIVKRLVSIENFGSMNVLCCDKTGTITEGSVRLNAACDIEGGDSEKALLYAYVNSSYETGFKNPLDHAIRTHDRQDISGFKKLDEVPYDFVRKRLSVLVSDGRDNLVITKGAMENVLEACSRAEMPDGEITGIDMVRDKIDERFRDLSRQGFRTLGICFRNNGSQESITREDEKDMVFLGFLAFFDPIKEDIAETIARLKKLGVSLKVITGDNALIASTVTGHLGFANREVLSGPAMHDMSDAALTHKVNSIDVFAEVEPNQKERIISSLRRSGNVVGYIGDGINDASALHAADVGISVNTAVDVAKEVADIVLLEKDLHVLANGVIEGRRTFANTLKYVFMATSANFGNMFSMAGASLFLPFLPLLPKQILLTNLLTDFPEMTIATDRVDNEMLDRPRRWNIKFIRNFMIVFGLLSSVFDYLTFGVLLLVFHMTVDEFRTGWFMESIISASMIVLVVRTRTSYLKSRPGTMLTAATSAVALATVIIPYTPVGSLFGFVPIPVWYLPVLLLIVVLYGASAEIVKRIFYRRMDI